jgi:hypothetical protein
MAVQTSVSPSGDPQAALVAIVVDEHCEILFDTLESSRKTRNLRQDPRVALVIGGWVPGDKRCVQYEGVADEPAGAELERLKRDCFGRLPGDAGPAAWPGLLYVRVRPRWVRYSDFNRTPPEVVEFAGPELRRVR